MSTKFQELVSEDEEVPRKPFKLRTLVRKKAILDRWEYEADAVPLLRRVLTRLDIYSGGLCMTIGAGIFVISGTVAQDIAGPAVVVSFLISGIAALIASLSYSEFSARVPACGSTYSYVYVTLGEFMAWMAGWITILEYALSAYVAHGMAHMVIKVAQTLNHGELFKGLPADNWNKIIGTILIVVLTFVVLFFGIKGSARFCRVMSFANVTTILFICVAGSINVTPSNWNNFAPYGFRGILKGAAKVLFAFAGFENSTTLATEVKDPKRSMPVGVILTLVSALLLYMLSSLVMTGMVPLKDIDKSAPFVGAFEADMSWAASVVGIFSLLCMTATIFTTLVGLPRILFQMSRDGLLWDFFSRLNRFKVPFWGTIFFGVVVCVIALVDLPDFSDIVCIGVLINYSMINIGVISLRFLDTERKMETKQICVLIATVCSCILVGVSLNLQHYDIVAPLCLIPFFVCMIMLYVIMPVSSIAHPPVESFLTPFVPFLPCFGTLLNVVLIAQLGIKPFWQVAVWIGGGSIIYFVYGVRNSRQNFIISTDQFYY